MNDGKISVRYARAILHFARNKGVEKLVYQEMFLLAKNLTTYAESFKTAFAHPDMTEKKLKALFKLAIGKDISTYSAQSIDFIVDKQRSLFMLRIALMYQTLYEKEHNILISNVISAQELETKTLEQIKQFASKSFNATTEIHHSIDPDLIGGFVLEIANQRLDASIRGKLNTLKKVL
ncbi:MAG: ATP synthase F1 subunit delta [Paludibacteraceae bacterium]|nr:ATP synthase F1 subunit delta [Paludibacteraceae bacterium]MBP6283922.1 ATP synthase F1 subunit delta [Paludibacteraceae bacterium]